MNHVKQAQKFISLSPLIEYLLVVTLEPALDQKITAIKRDFKEKFKVISHQPLENIITMVHFTQYLSLEATLLANLSKVISTVIPFKIELQNFGCHPTHSIFIKVLSKLPVQNLTNALRQTQKIMNLDAENKAHFIQEPQLLIAQKLKPWQFEKSWLEYEHIPFSGRFIVDKLSVLKRKKDGLGAYQIVKIFQFGQPTPATLQGNLFT
ncbi:MAG: hypothetical protein NVS9B7_01140 [Flavisolibacter sp.]